MHAQKVVLSTELVSDARRLVEETRTCVSVALNAALTVLHWRIEKRIGEGILGRKQPRYGAQFVSTLGREFEFELKFGKGFSAKSRLRPSFKSAVRFFLGHLLRDLQLVLQGVPRHRC